MLSVSDHALAPLRFLIVFALSTGAVLFLSTIPSLAQYEPNGTAVGAETVFGSWLADATGPVLLTLLVGGVLIRFAPDGARNLTDHVLRQPGFAFLYGLLSIPVIVFAVSLTVLPVLGWLFGIPLLFLALLVALIAAELGYLAIGRLVTETWPLVLAIATVVTAITALSPTPSLGAAAGFVITTMGIGSVVIDVVDVENTQRQESNALR